MKGRFLLDVNVLVAILRRDSGHHESAVAWIEQAHGERAELRVMAETLVAAVRILANPRIWHEPTPPGAAAAALDDLVASAGIRLIGADAPAWRGFVSVAGAVPLTTRMVPDALLVSVATAHGAAIVTFDKGMAEFPQATIALLR